MRREDRSRRSRPDPRALRGDERSDGQLAAACRTGDLDAFACLWERHRLAALGAARGIAPSLDAEDLVSAASLKILELLLDGRGPTGAFRPYLYQTIRTLAADRFRSPELANAELDELAGPEDPWPWADRSFDLGAVRRAFAGLNERWQAVLWYTEVEGLPPREIAPLLGLTANAVGVLAVRAKDALRSAWVEEHVNRELAESDCRATLERLQRFQRGKLAGRAARSVAQHLETCAACERAAAESTELNCRIGLVLGVVLLGGAGLGALFPTLLAGGGGAAAPVALASRTGNGTSAAGRSAMPGPLASVAITGVLAVAATIGVNAMTASDPRPGFADSGPAPPASERSEPEVAPEPDPARAASDSRGPAVIPKATAAAPPAANETRTTGREGSGREPQNPRQRTTPTSPVTPGPGPSPDPGTPIRPDPGPSTPPEDTVDSALAAGYRCSVDNGVPGAVYLGGTANRYGVLQLRIAQGAATPVEIVLPQFDPALEGNAPGNVFRDGIFTDPYGNDFTSGFFTGTDPEPNPVWHAPVSLTPLSQWPGLVDGALSNATVEIRLIVPGGTVSPWVEIDPAGTPCS